MNEPMKNDMKKAPLAAPAWPCPECGDVAWIGLTETTLVPEPMDITRWECATCMLARNTLRMLGG